jgi:hypothetical protein
VRKTSQSTSQRRARWLSLVLTLALLPGQLSTSAQSPGVRVYYNPLSGIASVTSRSGCDSSPSTPFVSKTDLKPYGDPGTTEGQLWASAYEEGADATAELQAPDVAVAMARATGCQGGATAILTTSAMIQDPLGRPSFWLRARIKASGESAAWTPSLTPSTYWHVKIAPALDFPPFEQFDTAGNVIQIAPPILDGSLILGITGNTGLGTDPAQSMICDTVGGCAYFDGDSNELDTTVRFLTTTGNLWVQFEAVAQGNALTIVDPIIEADPANPEVVVTMLGPSGPGSFPAPLAGTTPEELVAQGIDPGPFVRLGFFDSATPPPPPPPPPPAPSDTTPPATTASSNGGNANGWNKAQVTLTLNATDNAGGSGVKEVHYSLQGAATGQQVVPGDNGIVTISAEGMTTLTYFAVDNAGNQEQAKTLTIGMDKTPPLLSGLPSSSCSIWPPDHRLVQIASISASDGLSGLVSAPTVTVVSNEPDTGTGDGDLRGDIVIAGGEVQIRAERAGSGTGRVYTITATAIDRAGNSTQQTTTCRVPHDGTGSW